MQSETEKSNLGLFRERSRPFLRFFALFVLLAGSLFTLFSWTFLPYAKSINTLTADSAGLIMKLIGLSPIVNGPYITAGGFSVKIITECSAVFVSILFASFVFSYPAPLTHKFKGLLIGLPTLFMINNLRIVMIVLVGVHFRNFFDYAHVYMGQIIMIFVVLLGIVLWLQSVVGVDSCDKPGGFMGRLIPYSVLFFLVWFPMAEGYIYANLYLVKWILRPFGLHYPLPEELGLFPDTFNSFPVVAFAALVLATRTVTGFDKLKHLLIGLVMIFVTYYLFRLADVLFTVFHIRSAYRPTLALLILVQWGLPFLLWMLLMRDSLFARRGVLTCPICGRQKRGVLDHIRAKHPDQASGWQLTDGCLVNTPAR
jgi:archaeosortase B (VPXXXP-CTERM-specific)